jgi:D-alanyl-D-alanine carboxypeptidase/D-alanyl-D-alanine-endopeptidase (penicillin-binding protein 4)
LWPDGDTTAIRLKEVTGTAEDLRVPRPHPVVVSLTSAAAAVLVSGVVVVATQVGAVPPGSLRFAAADPSPSPSASASGSPRPATGLDTNLTAAIKSRMDSATSSSYAVVVDVAGRGRVVAVNAGRGLLPASTEKLFTTLPLLISHPNDRLDTVIGSTSAPQSGVVHGDLVVRTSGDPTLMGHDLTTLARQVHDAGVRKVTGRLVLGYGGLPWTRTRSGWKSSYVPWDIGPLSPFAVHSDTWRTTTHYVTHPTGGNLGMLRNKLVKAGVRITGGIAAMRNPTIATTFGQHSSDTIAGIIRRTLRQSNNFYAEQLLNIEGWNPVNDVIKAAGSGGTATDGSGLSLTDRRTAAGEVALLKYAHTSSAAGLLMQSLPTACRTGTLKEEFCNTSGAGHVWAKTGTIDHVKALAGYTTDAKGRWVTFAIITNGDSSTSRAMRSIVNSVLQLRHYAG